MISLEEIKEKLEEANKMIEEYNKQNDLKLWIPKNGENFYFIDYYGSVDYINYTKGSSDDRLLKRTRVFQTEEQANKWIEIDTYLREKSFEPDWENSSQIKCYLYYDYKDKKFCFRGYYHSNHFVPFYFENLEILSEILENYTTEELKFYFNIGE